MQSSFNCEWPEWFRRKGYNWKNFTFIECSIEYTLPRHMGFSELEIMLGLLGFTWWLAFSWGVPIESDEASTSKIA